MIKVCLIGVGKTGQDVARGLLQQKNMELVAAICSPKSKKRGMDIGTIIGMESTGVTIVSSDGLEDVIFRTKPDVVVDFSNSAATMKNVKILSKLKVNIVIGTTGFTEEELAELYNQPRRFHNGIVYAPNITLGVNTVMLLSNIAANILNNYDFQITETHHKHKKDSPSGTALKLAVEMEKGLNASGVYNKEIPINAIRAGGVIGRHEVQIIGEDDKIEISHESFSRKAFAQGAIYAINYIYKKSGYFEMKEVLNLNKVLYDFINSNTDICL